MSTRTLSPADAYRLAFLPAEVEVPLRQKALVDAVAKDAAAGAMEQALKSARYHLGNSAGSADKAYAQLVKTASELALKLPAPPKRADGFAAWFETIRSAVLDSAKAAANATTLAAFQIGGAAAALHGAIWTGHAVTLLRTAEAEHALLEERATALAQEIAAARQKLLDALSEAAIPAVVARRKDALAALLAQGPDVATATSEAQRKALFDWNLQVDGELSELQQALAFPVEKAQSGPASGEEEKLHAQILANPDDNALRQHFAELAQARSDPRGELITVQFAARATAQNPNDSHKAVPHTQRAAALIKFHPEWTDGLARLGAKSVRFFRGFAGFVEMDAGDFLRSPDALFQLAPIQHLQLHDAAAHIAALAASPHLSRIRSLILKQNALTDDAAKTLAASPQVAGLRYLDLSQNKIGDDGIEAIVASPHLSSLRYLNLDKNTGENPADAKSYSDDEHFDWQPRKRGQALEAKYGKKPFLHPTQQDWPPELDTL